MSLHLKLFIISNLIPAASFLYGIFLHRTDIILNSLLTVACILSLAVFHKKTGILKSTTYYSCVIFILLSVFAGRTLKIYFLIPLWDKILHFISGFIFANAGKDIYIKLNGKHNKKLMNIFIISFAVAAAGIWEIYEFSIDKIFKLSSQNGLDDTMQDMVAGSASAVLQLILLHIFKKKT